MRTTDGSPRSVFARRCGAWRSCAREPPPRAWHSCRSPRRLPPLRRRRTPRSTPRARAPPPLPSRRPCTQARPRRRATPSAPAAPSRAGRRRRRRPSARRQPPYRDLGRPTTRSPPLRTSATPWRHAAPAASAGCRRRRRRRRARDTPLVGAQGPRGTEARLAGREGLPWLPRLVCAAGAAQVPPCRSSYSCRAVHLYSCKSV
jgi:hypothetical protein